MLVVRAIKADDLDALYHMATQVGSGMTTLKPDMKMMGDRIEVAVASFAETIPPEERSAYLVQQRMRFEPTIDTPFGVTQAEVRILYMWPDGGVLTPALSLVRLGRGKMMGVDHNKDQEWVGGSGAFYK